MCRREEDKSWRDFFEKVRENAVSFWCVGILGWVLRPLSMFNKQKCPLHVINFNEAVCSNSFLEHVCLDQFSVIQRSFEIQCSRTPRLVKHFCVSILGASCSNKHLFVGRCCAKFALLWVHQAVGFFPKIPARKGFSVQNGCWFYAEVTLNYAIFRLNYANSTLNYAHFTLHHAIRGRSG